jgi:pimeloyl-[acyl-carrier protein] methyl ester esterase
VSAPLVFLHGWGLHGGIWSETAAALDRPDALMLDLPGYGATPTVTPYDAPHLADALTTRLPPDAIVIGWSMGGMAALALAAKHPIKALVLVGASPVFVNRADWPHGLAPEVLAGFAESLSADYRATLLRFLSLQARGGEAAREVNGRLRDSVFARGEPSPETLAAGLGLLRDVDLRGEAAQIHCPTLIIHGDYDNLCPPAAADWFARTIPNARLALHARAAHAPFLSHPDWFVSQLKEFIHAVGG